MITMLMRSFDEKYPSDTFEKMGLEQQQGYLKEMSSKVRKIAIDELNGNAPPGMARGSMLFHLYLIALAEGDAVLVNHMADRLEPLNKLGYEILTI